MNGTILNFLIFLCIGVMGLLQIFFGRMKEEMFYGKEKNFKSLEQLEQEIKDYIKWYNNKRISTNLKGLTPIEYRNQALEDARI